MASTLGRRSKYIIRGVSSINANACSLLSFGTQLLVEKSGSRVTAAVNPTTISARSVKIVPKSVLQTIPRREWPEEDIPQPVEYSGPEKLRVAYVLDRQPVVSRQAHSIEHECIDMLIAHNNFHARHNYGSFWEYFPEWQKAKKKQENELKKLKKKAKDLGPAGHIRVPNKPPLPLGRRLDEMGEEAEEKIKKRIAMLKHWKPAPRITQADLDDNRYSINRKLDQRLYFIVQDAKTGLWQFPTGIRENPDTLRMAAERKFFKDMGKEVRSYFISNAPVGHYIAQDDPTDLTFFFHCIYLIGRPPFRKMAKEWKDHAWVTRHELADYDFITPEYKNIAYNMLWDGNEIA